jgi:hypothetical protein
MGERIRVESVHDDAGGYIGEAAIDITGTCGDIPTGILNVGGRPYKVMVEDGYTNCVPGETILAEVYGEKPPGTLRANFLRNNGCFLERYLAEGATAKAVISARNNYDLTSVMSSPYIRKCPGGVDGVITQIKDCWFSRGKETIVKVNDVLQNRRGLYILLAEPANEADRKDPDKVVHVVKTEFGTMNPDRNTMEMLSFVPRNLYAALFMTGYHNYIVSKKMTKTLFGDDLADGLQMYANLLSRSGPRSHKLIIANNHADLDEARDAIERLGYAIDEVDCLNDF